MTVATASGVFLHEPDKTAPGHHKEVQVAVIELATLSARHKTIQVAVRESPNLF